MSAPALRHRAFTIFLLLVLILPVSCGRNGGLGCGSDKGPGGVNVLLALPKGPVEWVSSIDVSFDHSMVELGQATDRTGKSPLRVNPRVTGRFNWIGTKTASFIPDRPLPYATRFQVTVPAGLRSIDGKSVGEDVTWEFTTPTPDVVRSFPESQERRPEGGRRGRSRRDVPREGPDMWAATRPINERLQPVPLDLSIVIEFNQPVVPSAVKRAARLSPEGREGDAVDIRVARPGKREEAILRGWPQAPETHRVAITAARPLARDTIWELSLDPDLKGSEGPLAMGQPFQLTFRTYGPFVVRQVRPGDASSGTVILDLSNPVDSDSLIAHLRFDPPVTLRGAWQGNPSETGVYGNFRPGTRYTMTVSPGLKDMFGNLMEPGTPLAFTTGDLGPTVALAPQGAVLERSQKREIAVLLTNVETVRLSMKALPPNELAPFLRFEMYGGEEHWGWPMSGGTTRTIRRRTGRNITDTVYVSTDEVLGSGGGGVVAVQVISTDPLPPRQPNVMRPVPPRDKTIIRVTDLGVTSKVSGIDGLAWVTSLASGGPVEGASLEIRDASGRVVWSGTSGRDGLARTAGLALDEGSPPSPYRLFARLGNDYTYLTLGRDWSLEAWNFGVEAERWNPDRDLDGFIYGDRELYRPGETARLKTMLRRRTLGGLEPPAAGTVVWLEIMDPRGNLVVAAAETLSSFGTFDRDIPLDRAARAGTYGVTVSSSQAPENRRWSVWGSFRVEEYRAPEFKVEVASRRPWYQSGQALEAEVTASYLFGAPLAGGTVQWSLSRRPAWFSPPGYDEFSFMDPEILPEYEVLAARGDEKLGADGRATIHPPLDLGALPVSMEYTLEAEVRDLTGQASAAEEGVVVHRGLAYPGVKIGKNLVKEGETVPVSVVLVSPDGKPAANANARVSLVRREWRTARRLLVGGIIGSETSEVDSVFETRTLPAGPGPHDLEFQVKTPGYFRVVVEATDGAKNKLRSAGDFYAWGSGSYAWGWEPGVKLDLVTDKKKYQPGETARVLVRSPFPDALVLVTLEREGIRNFWTRRLLGTAETVEIPIPVEGSAPNLFVSVALVTGSDARDGADPRIRLPEFRLGYTRLEIDHSSRVLEVRAAPSRREAMPGDSLSVAITLTDASGRPVEGEVSLAVVDEAVLRLLGTKTPDPVGRFYRPRGVSVVTSELRRLVRRALSDSPDKGAAGGGGGDEAFRSLFATTAYWHPSLRTDSSGRVTAGFKLPDNLTTFRIMAVALDRTDRFGSAEDRFVVTKPLLVQPALPRFANAGDRFRVGAVVHNRTDQAMSVQVASQLEGIESRGTAAASIEVPPRGSRRADFDVEAPRVGTARVRISARSGSMEDGIQVSFPVVLPATPRVEANSGPLLERVTEGVAVPKEALPESSRVEVTVAPTLVGRVENAFDYLENYPYLCLEQVASAEWAKLLEARLYGTEPLDVAARRAVERLSPFLKEDGGFALWPSYHSTSAPYTTAWALLVLAEARRAGGDVEPLVRPAVQYLNWMFQSTGMDTVGKLVRGSEWAMALWALAETPGAWSQLDFRSSPYDFLMASRVDLPATARLYLALASLHHPGGERNARLLLSELDNHVEQFANQAFLNERNPRALRDQYGYDFDYYWNSPIRLNGLYLAASARSGRRSPLDAGVVRWLMEQTREARWPSTQDNIMALLGLTAYRETWENEPPRVNARVTFAGAPPASERFTSISQAPASFFWPAGAPGSRSELHLDREGTGALYYTAAIRYLEPTIGGRPVETSLTLVRTYEVFDAAGDAGESRAATRIAAGDLVLVRLTLVVPEASDFLALADPLPAGLEPVNLGFVTTAQEAARRYLQTGVYQPGREGLPAEYEEQRDREVRAFTGPLSPGVYEYRYLARAITPGRFAAPRARAELMYHPEVVALTDGPWIEIVEK